MPSTIRNFARIEMLGWAALIALGGMTGSAGVCLAQQASQGAAQKSKTTAKTPVNKESAIRRAQPAGVKELPAEFVEKLTVRGCTIPQFDSGEGAEGVGAEPNNVIHGEFTRRGQEDWAVLCSNGKTSTIVIFWGKATACPASLARLDDAHYLKAGKDKKLQYSRSIRALGESGLDERAGVAGLKPMSHQGIDDRFVGKSSAFFIALTGSGRFFQRRMRVRRTDKVSLEETDVINRMTVLGARLVWLPRSIEQQIPHPPGKTAGFGMTASRGWSV